MWTGGNGNGGRLWERLMEGRCGLGLVVVVVVAVVLVEKDER